MAGVLKLKPGILFDIHVLSVDDAGRQQLKGGEQVRAQLSSGPAPVALEVYDNGDGSYRVATAVQVSGEYKIALVNGLPVAGSPVSLVAPRGEPRIGSPRGGSSTGGSSALGGAPRASSPRMSSPRRTTGRESLHLLWGKTPRGIPPERARVSVELYRNGGGGGGTLRAESPLLATHLDLQRPHYRVLQEVLVVT